MLSLLRSALVLHLLLSAASCDPSLNIAQKLALPEEIAKDLDVLMVDRRGKHDDAYMITESIEGYVNPNQCYRLVELGLSPCDGILAEKLEPEVPSHAVINGSWGKLESELKAEANILGGLGCFTISTSTLFIPIASSTAGHLEYYGAKLLGQGDSFYFEADAPLPFTKMAIGGKYVDGYLMDPNMGGGAYLEYHDRPHFHMPADEHADGYLILGRKEGNVYHLSAFKIPYGYAIYTGPNVIHSDSFLVGKYFVVYSVTKNYSTAIVKSSEGKLVNIHFQ